MTDDMMNLRSLVEKSADGHWCTDQISTVCTYVASIENSLVDRHAIQT